MTFETPKPEPRPGDTLRVDTDLRVAIAKTGTADAASRRPRAPEKIPRIAKVCFTIGLSLLGAMVLIPIVGLLIRSGDAPAQHAAAPAPAPQPASSSIPDSVKPRTASSSSGGGGGGLAGGGDGGGRVDPPMPVPALRVLTSLWAFLNEASHPSPGQLPGSLDPRREYFPNGSLDGSPADVLENLDKAQIRVARQPALALRVVGESRTSSGYAFEVEIVSANAGGDELVSRGRIDMVPIDEETMRITRVEALEPFDQTGAKVTASTFEQGTGPRDAPETPRAEEPPTTLPPVRLAIPDAPAVVATYPYIIR